MKHFEITLEKMGRSGSEKEGWSMEIDDITNVWQHNKDFGGIRLAEKWVKQSHARLPIGHIDEIDEHNHRMMVDGGGHYDNIMGLESESVGMVCVMVREFRYEDNDPEYGEKQFFYDGEWS